VNRTIAPQAVGILVATLMSACQPQYVAPNEELRAYTQSLRAHGVTLTVPANLREEPIPDQSVAPHPRYYSWAGPRVWVTVEACVGVGDHGPCVLEGQERPHARTAGAEIRRFESLEAHRPRGMVWVTPDGASHRTVVLIIGRTLGDSALVRRIADTVQPSPD
jgi:hypothetical protein